MQNVKKFFDKYILVWISILSLPSVWALFVPGFFGASDDMHIGWLYELDRAVKMGQIPPRFAPDLSFGFGYPLFNFLFPLPFYIAEIFHLLGLSLVDSIKAVFFLSVPMSAIFMFKFLREYTGRGLSLAGAILYAYTPYRATDLYIRGAFGEVVSFVILPILAWSTVKLTSNDNKLPTSAHYRWLGLTALSLAALVLSHNITVYMFFPFLLLLGAGNIFFHASNKTRAFFQTCLAIFLGLLASIYFWLPAMLESNLMRYDTVFAFIDHFPTIKQLITPYWGYGASVAGPYDGMSFFIGTVNLAVLGGGFLLLFFRWKAFDIKQKVVLSWAGIFVLLAIFMMNYRSSLVWETLPFLPYFQFPWRFLMATTFLIPIFFVTLEKLRFNKFLVWPLLMIIIALNFSNFHPQDFLGRRDDYYINRYIPVPVASQEYLGLEEEYLRLPKATQKRPQQNYPRILPADSRVVSVVELNALDAIITTDSQESFVLDYNKYLFPGWQATINDQPQQLIPGDPFGQITLTVPGGVNKVKISFEETNFKKMLDTLSLISIGLSLVMISKGRLTTYQKHYD